MDTYVLPLKDTAVVLGQTFDPDSLPEYIRSKFSVLENGCWSWTAGKTSNGYSDLRYGGKHKSGHILVWEILNKKDFPMDLVGDHTCHKPKECSGGKTCPHRLCVNPDHIEPITHLENNRRGCKAQATHCKNKHEFTKVTTYINKAGHRSCRICRAAARKRNRKSK